MRPRIRLDRGLALAGMLLPLVLLVGGCGSPVPTPGPSDGASTVANSPAGPPASPATVPSASASAPTATGAQAPSSSGLAVDPGLLDVLPKQVDGVALEPDPTTAEQIASDPTLAASAESIAVALAISPGTSAGDDIAIASVIRLRPGVFGDAWFLEWRTTYDAAACDVAGGVRGEPLQVEIGPRAVYVGTCAGNAHTYHVHLADPALIVSVTSAGPRDLGRLVVAGIAE